MKLLEDETNSAPSAEECAALLADTVPLIMRTIRAEMRKHRSADLSVPQFRALAFIGRHPGTSISAVAEHIGLTLPSISNMLDRLEARDLIARRDSPDDRRRTCLELTPLGQAAWQSSTQATRAHLAEQLAALAPDERAIIRRALHSLRCVFDSVEGAEEDSEG